MTITTKLELERIRRDASERRRNDVFSDLQETYEELRQRRDRWDRITDACLFTSAGLLVLSAVCFAIALSIAFFGSKA